MIILLSSDVTLSAYLKTDSGFQTNVERTKGVALSQNTRLGKKLNFWFFTKIEEKDETTFLPVLRDREKNLGKVKILGLILGLPN